MPRVIHFEIPAGNPEEAIKFYRETFGWKVEQYEDTPYWLVMTGEKSETGIDGAIYKKDWMDKTVNTIQVENLEEYMDKVKSNGGKILREPMDIPEVGRHVYALDIEGNMFGMLEPKK